ncbi:MarR family winged helix-turn-helix transcriptional regulator [Mycolicibacterium iranicum]|uniref:HTH marR-type domain-containing protein n=1 Tax=Mycolicibacterium iranicum TaxID=912594 RepID=A0A178LQD4_MYCIR|nr:helix-turn-helix domain-containing protein [Mycolicibacterium iranicum]OAN34293.1 hypothetical protein A4X20_26975 [Mycolicibacterium iranicum]
MASGDAVEQTERSRVTAEEVSWALRDFTRAAVDADYAIARRVGLRPMDYTALNHVFAHRGSLSPNQLSDRLGISTGSASELVDRLERAGHVERHRNEHDRRRVSLSPTPASVDRVLGELAPLLTELDEIARQYSAPERDLIAGYLRRVAQALRDYETSTAPVD